MEQKHFYKSGAKTLLQKGSNKITNEYMTVLTEVGKTIIQFLYAIGYFSEIIIIVISILLLRTNIYSVLFYIIGIIFSLFVNQTLKRLIKELRPSEPVKFLNSDKFDNKAMIYGMPSGHSQHLFFSTMYLYLTITHFYPWVLLICSIIGFLTMVERYYFRNHTIRQLVVGAIVGVLLAYIVWVVGVKVKPIVGPKIKILDDKLNYFSQTKK